MADVNFAALSNVIQEELGQAVVDVTSSNDLLFNLIYQNNRDPVSDRRGPKWKAQYTKHAAYTFSKGGTYGAADNVQYLAPSLGWARYGANIQVDEETAIGLRENPILTGMELSNQIRQAVRGIVEAADEDLRTNDPTTGDSDGLAGIPAMISASNTYAGIDRSSTTEWQCGYAAGSIGALAAADLLSLHKDLTQTELRSYTHIVASYDFATDIAALGTKADPPRHMLGEAQTATLGYSGMNLLQPVAFYQGRPVLAWPGWTSGRIDAFRFDNIRMEVRKDFGQPEGSSGFVKVQGADRWIYEITLQAQTKYLDPRNAGVLTGVTT